MIVLKASDYQKRNLHGEKRGNCLIEFVKDGAGHWVTSASLLEDERFADLHGKLKRLKQIEYTPHEAE